MVSAAAPATGGKVRRPPREDRTELTKRASVVARRIEDDIAAAGWQIGAIFGRESELCERYGASRSVMLEAIRLVEHHGVGRMRRGPKGGLVVQAPDVRGPATALVIYLDSVGTTVRDLMDVRLILEPLAVEQVIRRLTPESLEALHAAAEPEAGTRGLPDGALPDHMHNEIGLLCGNPVLGLFLDVLANLNIHFAGPLGSGGAGPVDEVAAQLRKEHADLLDAIARKDVTAARELTVAHLAGMHELMLRARPEGARVSVPAAKLPGGTGRFAETLADRIRADLQADGVAVGVVVGSEASMLAKYGASRQVLREAVRLLEHHGIAKMQRGPGGGLVVTDPNPGASIEAIAVNLSYADIDAGDIAVVWQAVELGCLDRVVGRRDEPEVLERLKEAAVLDAPAFKANGALESSFHHELAALSGNPVLELFFQVLTTLWGQRALRGRAVQDVLELEHGEVGQTAHLAVLKAVTAGDSAKAQRRLAKHLASVAKPWE